MKMGQFEMVEECYTKSQDYNSLLLFYSSYGDQEGLQKMAKGAVESGKFNVAFEAYFILAEPDNCIDVLLKSKRISEAAIFAKAYAPSRLEELIPLWTKHLKD